MQCCNVCRWCYFRSHFVLGLMRSGAVVTMDTVTWHILKWPPDLSRGVLTSALLNKSNRGTCCIQSSLFTFPLLMSYFIIFLPPANSLIPFPLSPCPAQCWSHSPNGYSCHLLAQIIITSDQNGYSILGILQ